MKPTSSFFLSFFNIKAQLCFWSWNQQPESLKLSVNYFINSTPYEVFRPLHREIWPISWAHLTIVFILSLDFSFHYYFSPSNDIMMVYCAASSLPGLHINKFRSFISRITFFLSLLYDIFSSSVKCVKAFNGCFRVYLNR